MQKVNASSSIVPVLVVMNDGSTAGPAGDDLADPVSGHTPMGGITRNVTQSGLKRRRQTVIRRKVIRRKETCSTNTQKWKWMRNQ